jgi:hypothetical protein
VIDAQHLKFIGFGICLKGWCHNFVVQQIPLNDCSIGKLIFKHFDDLFGSKVLMIKSYFDTQPSKVLAFIHNGFVLYLGGRSHVALTPMYFEGKSQTEFL